MSIVLSRTAHAAHLLLAATLAWLAFVGHAAASVPVQTLDRVDVYNATTVLEMNFSSQRPPDFKNLGIAGSRFTACQLTGTSGLFCLDSGRLVRNWPNTAVPTTNYSLFSCADIPGLDTKKPDTCTAMTVNLAGDIWVAGKKSSSYSLLKVVLGPCGAGYQSVGASAYCYKEYFAGRPLIVDITPVDGDSAASFELPTSSSSTVKGCVGVLGLEERKTLEFFPDTSNATECPTAPYAIATGQRWGLQGNEQLLSAALLQVPVQVSSGTIVKNFVVATTTNGRILSVDTSVAGAAATPVFKMSDKEANLSPCVAVSAPQYGLRTSAKSGRVYVTDRNYCQVLALQPVMSGLQLTSLVSAQDPNTSGDLTLKTASYPPDEPTLAPGISIDLKKCNPSCTLVKTDTGQNAATLSGVQLSSTDSGMVLFQVKNIPDCRWQPSLCAGVQGTLLKDSAGQPVALNAVSASSASSLYLNVTPLLPKEVTDLFKNDPLPDMWVSPGYRAQVSAERYTFDAFFGVTEDNVVFKNVFSFEYDVCRLTGGATQYDSNGNWIGCDGGKELGCGYDYSEASKPNLKFDVTTTISERHMVVGGPGDPTTVDPSSTSANPPTQYTDMMLNTGCYNPTVGSGDRWSLYPYNLEVTPRDSVTNKAVFAYLVDALYDDLRRAQWRSACKINVDGVGNPPLSTGTCSTLEQSWQTGEDKLFKCFSATVDPKQSSGDQNCQAFQSALNNYESSLPTSSYGPDPANRIGELRARVKVIRHIFVDRFLPSIPANGFGANVLPTP